MWPKTAKFCRSSSRAKSERKNIEALSDETHCPDNGDNKKL